MEVIDATWTALWIAYSVLVISMISPSVFIYQFIWRYWEKLDLAATPETLPKVAIILSLRGADPHLEDCITGLLNQDYACYSIYIIVDSIEDPAMKVVTEVMERNISLNVKVQVDLLKYRGEHCSLKLSAQQQVITRLSDDVEVIVFVDADSIVTSHWLRYMVTPFVDPTIGCTTGHRWFVPLDRSVASFARHMFNIGLFAVLYAFRIPWGGSMAVRRNVLRDSNILTYWRQCLTEDVSLCRGLRELNLRLEFVPAATLFNSEPTDLRGTYNFIHRQFMHVRLHFVLWPILLTGLLAFTLSVWISIVLLSFGLATQRVELWVSAITPMLIIGFAEYVALKVSDRLVRQREGAPPYSPCGWKLFPAFYLLLAMMASSLFAISFVRSIEWRGIKYRIEGRDRIHLVKYAPYRRVDQNRSRSLSIS